MHLLLLLEVAGKCCGWDSCLKKKNRLLDQCCWRPGKEIVTMLHWEWTEPNSGPLFSHSVPELRLLANMLWKLKMQEAIDVLSWLMFNVMHTRLWKTGPTDTCPFKESVMVFRCVQSRITNQTVLPVYETVDGMKRHFRQILDLSSNYVGHVGLTVGQSV